MLSRSFTKTELRINQSKHKRLPPQIDVSILQNNTLKHVYYLFKPEEVFVIRNMTLILSLLILVQINCQYALVTKVIMILVNL